MFCNSLSRGNELLSTIRDSQPNFTNFYKPNKESAESLKVTKSSTELRITFV